MAGILVVLLIEVIALHLLLRMWSPAPYLVALKRPVVAQGLYGMRKEVSLLGLAPDDAASFKAALRQRFADWQQDEA